MRTSSAIRSSAPSSKHTGVRIAEMPSPNRRQKREAASAVDKSRLDREGLSVVVRGTRRWRVDARALKTAVIKTLEKAGPSVAGEVTVVLCDDKAIRRLNKRYRERDTATDVLSFDVGDGRTEGEPFGDVVVSVETARRQARAYGASLTEEMQRLIVHGTLHL